MVSDWPFSAYFPSDEKTKNKKQNINRTFSVQKWIKEYLFLKKINKWNKEHLPINVVFSGYKDQSRNPISSSRIIYVQGGSACKYTTNVKKCLHFLLKWIKRKKKEEARSKQRRKREIICCDHVNKCFKFKYLNKVSNKFRYAKKSLTCFKTSDDKRTIEIVSLTT